MYGRLGSNRWRNTIACYRHGASAPITRGASSYVDLACQIDPFSPRNLVHYLSSTTSQTCIFTTIKGILISHYSLSRLRSKSLNTRALLDQGASAPMTCMWCPLSQTLNPKTLNPKPPKPVEHRSDSSAELLRLSLAGAHTHKMDSWLLPPGVEPTRRRMH
jgi:hypothetical protein